MDRLDKIKEFLKPLEAECTARISCINCSKHDKCDKLPIKLKVTTLLTAIEDMEKLEKYVEGEANE